VHLCQVYILDIVCIVCVLDLTTSPVHTLDLDSFAVLDCASKGDCLVSTREEVQG
jgi:hypothetical protein